MPINIEFCLLYTKELENILATAGFYIQSGASINFTIPGALGIFTFIVAVKGKQN